MQHLRKFSTVSCGIAVASIVLLAGSAAHAEWFKGNTHCHTEYSPDSDTPIEDLMAWYKAHGYDFVVLTDHNQYKDANFLGRLEAFDDGLGRMAPLVDAGFILIPGEELTRSAHHVNGLDLPYQVDPGTTIAASFEVVWAAGAMPQLNHPEWNYLTARDVIEEVAELDGVMFMEVFNAHPGVIERSGMSSEDIWDGVLTAGQLMWAVATDDAHTLEGGHTPPGGGVVYVEADSLDPESILAAMARGRLYASSGATLADFSWTSNLYEVDAPGATEITFLGRDGAVLQTTTGDYATYDFRGDELYVRARVRSPAGYAWTQPIYVGALPPNEPPTAVIGADPLRGEAPLRVRFDGRGSSDPDDEVVSWRWDFGDGQLGRGEVIGHTYLRPGTYEVDLTVFDQAGAPAHASVSVTVEPAGTGPSNNGEPANNGAANNGEPTNNGAANNGAANNGADDGGNDGGGNDDDGSTPAPVARQGTDDGCSIGSASAGRGAGAMALGLALLALLGRRRC